MVGTMIEADSFALVPKPSGAIEKAEPGAKRILADMVTGTLALAMQQQRGKLVLSVLMGAGDADFAEMVGSMVQERFSARFDVRMIADTNSATELLRRAEKQPFDLLFAVINNILWDQPDMTETRIRKVVELLAHLKAQYGKPIIAFSGWRPETFDLTEVLAQVGIDAFFWLPFDPEAFADALEVCLRDSHVRQI